MSEFVLQLAGDAEAGHWVTIDGSHVYIKDGMVAKGPAALQGKTLSNAHSHVAAEHKTQAAYHGRLAETSRAAGDEESAKIHDANSKAHAAKAMHHQKEAVREAGERKTAADHAKLANEHHAESVKAREAGDKSTHEYHDGAQRMHRAEADRKSGGGKPAGGKAATAEKPAAQVAAPKSGGTTSPKSNVAPTDEQVSSIVKSKSAANGLTPIHEVRKEVAAKHGDQFAGQHLDKQLKRLRGDKVDLISNSDPTSVPKEHMASAVQGAGEKFVWAKNRGGSGTGAAAAPSASTASSAASSARAPTIAEAHQRFQGLINGSGTTTTSQAINSYLEDVKKMPMSDIHPLMETLEFAGKATSKADAADKIGMTLNQHNGMGAKTKDPNFGNDNPSSPNQSEPIGKHVGVSSAPAKAPTKTQQARMDRLTAPIDIGDGPKEALPSHLEAHAKAISDQLEGIRHGAVTTGTITSTLDHVSNSLSKEDVDKLAKHFDIAGKSSSKREAIGKIRTAFVSQLEMHNKANSFSADAYILDASTLTTAKEIPGALEGLPTWEEIPTDEQIGEEDGTPIFGKKNVPVQYFWKELARAGRWTHRGARALDGSPVQFNLTNQDFDEAVANFKDRQKAGIRPFIPDTHVEQKNAAANNGEVIGLERRGDKLIGKLKVVGSAAIEKVKKNDVSVYLVNGSDQLVVDAYGKKYKGRVLHHVALTPNPNQPHLSPFERIAASADAVEIPDVPVYTFGVPQTAAPSRRSHKMNFELAQQVRSRLGIAADVSDEELDDVTAQRALSLSAECESLTSERNTLKTTNLALSADAPRKPDPIVMAMYTENVAAKRESAIKAGALTEVQAKVFDRLILDAAGAPTTLALSACGDNRRPLGFQLWDALSQLGADGIRTGNGVPRSDVIPALDADGKPQVGADNAPMSDARRKEMLGSIGITPAK